MPCLASLTTSWWTLTGGLTRLLPSRTHVAWTDGSGRRLPPAVFRAGRTSNGRDDRLCVPPGRAGDVFLTSQVGPFYDIWITYQLARTGGAAYYHDERLVLPRSRQERQRSNDLAAHLGTISCETACSRILPCCRTGRSSESDSRETICRPERCCCGRATGTRSGASGDRRQAGPQLEVGRWAGSELARPEVSARPPLATALG